MDNENFFETIEKKLKTTVPKEIKSHLKFHRMDNFQMAAKLNENMIKDCEDFARFTLHRILRPHEMINFYGLHFQKKPQLFVFTLGERMFFKEIQQLCTDICAEKKTCSDESVSSNLNSLTEELSISSESERIVEPKENVEIEDNRDRTRNTGLRLWTNAPPGFPMSRAAIVMTKSKTVRLRYIKPETQPKDIKEIIEFYNLPPPNNVILESEQCNGFINNLGYVEFSTRNVAINASQILNGVAFKGYTVSCHLLRK